MERVGRRHWNLPERSGGGSLDKAFPPFPSSASTTRRRSQPPDPSAARSSRRESYREGMDPLDQAPAVFEIEFLLVLLDLVDDFYADPAAAFAANRDFYLGFPAQFPGWYFAAPGVTTHAAAMAANPQFFLRYPGALDPLAGPEVLLNDAFNPWIEVAPRRNLRSRRDDRPPPEVYPEAPPVEVSQGVPWYPPRIRYRRYVRKHYVVRKGGRTNLQKAYQARKGSFTSSPNGGPGHFVYGSYGAGGCLEY